jgi:3-hydroxybutyrate dehydrogenase
MNTKVAAITGAASGIGLEIALSLKDLGFTSICLDIKTPPTKHNLVSYQCDVSQEKVVSEVFNLIAKEHGPCAVLINNSGLQYMSPIDEFPIEKWDQLLGVILTGTFLCSRFAIPQMKSQNWGRIINISSVHGKEASPYKAAYVAAKHGVLGLTKVIAKELAPYNITANSICPGYVDTPLMQSQVAQQMALHKISKNEVLESVFLKNQDIKKLTTPKQVADMVKFLISDSASTITGEAFNVSGGWGMGH